MLKIFTGLLIQIMIVSVLYPGQIYGQDEKFSEVDRYLTELTDKQEFSGYIMLFESSGIQFDKGYGYSDIKKKKIFSGNTQFCLSSASKLFTAVSVIKLAQEGKLSVADTIGKYFSNLGFGSKITIHHLLTHSSGLTDYYLNPDFSHKNIKSCTDVLPYIKDQKLLFNPGDSVKYSTTGMMLLGAVIEKITSLNYQEYLRKEILKPLKMKNTSFVNFTTAYEKTDQKYSYARGYVKDKSGSITEYAGENDFVPLAAGGIWSSAGDLFKFYKAIFVENFIQPEYRSLMLEPKVFSGWPDCYFGYVWITINNKNEKTRGVGHAGNSLAHHSYFYIYDQGKRGIILLSNAGYADIFKIGAFVEKKFSDWK
jgi:CubicO group peptidase (beta-lactamase class C family)